MDDLIELAKAHKGHGLKGEVKIKFHNPDSSLLLDSKQVFLQPLSSMSSLDKKGIWYTVESLRGAGKAILKLKEFSDLTSVEKILPFSLSIERENLLPLKEDEFLLDDLVGLIVIDIKTQKEIGKISSIREGKIGLNLIFTLHATNEEVELPFKDHFFPEVNLDEKKISCLLPEYI